MANPATKVAVAGFTSGTDPRILYWRRGEPVQNFGDYLSEFLAQRMLGAPRVEADAYRLVGSTIAEWLIQDDLAEVGRPADGVIAYWGCGIRDETPPAEALRRHCRFFGVRGPLTRDRLKLGPSTVLGDTGLLAPLMHRPAARRSPSGAICIPHVNDDKADGALLKLSGAGRVVRPTIPATEEALLQILDDIAGAEFVLSGSLHGAIIACAYGVPFAYWDTGHVDLTFKWRDFAASVNVPSLFVSTVEEGRIAYRELIAPALKIPPLTPLLEICPFEVLPSFRLRALAHDGLISARESEGAETLLSARDAEWRELSQELAEENRAFRQSRLEQTIAVQKDLEEVRARLEQTISGQKDLEAAREQLALKLQAAGEEAGALQSELQTERGEHAEALKALAARDEAAERLTTELETARAAVRELEHATQDARDQAGRLEQELASAQAASAEAQSAWNAKDAERQLAWEERDRIVATQAELLESVEKLALTAAVAQDRLAFKPTTTVSETAVYDPTFGARDQHEWLLRSAPTTPQDVLGLYDVRPEDAVLEESARGTDFLDAFGLLSEEPDFEGAVEALNRLAHNGSLVGEGEAREPQVSIIIPVYGQLSYTLNCLHSLQTHRAEHTFEVIVADDRSPDATGEHLPSVTGVRYLQQARNLGFIDNCNSAAELARGAWVIMLNNDTRVVEGWLDELIGTFEHFPNAGLVGSKLLYPDGVLQEAGGIIWRHGDAWNYGRGDDPNRPEYCYARRVDYVSGASIALPTELWRELGGFDPFYRPAYAEDSDLAFRVRAAGRETWLQPLSRVIHYEGKTSGTDVTQGVKAYQVVNRTKLLQRWSGVLADHAPNGVQPWRERDRSVARRVLVIDATTPTPDQDAGSVTSIKVMTVFQQLGYKVVFAPLHNFLFQKRYTRDLQRIGVECLYAPFVMGLEPHLKRFGDQYDVVHVFRPDILKETVDLIERYCPGARLIYNNMDLHYLRLARQAVVERSPELAERARSKKQDEFATMRRAHTVCVPSTTEQEILDQNRFPRPTVVMPFMVDLIPPEAPFAVRKDIVFLGGYSHTPNIDAALWLAEEIWPRLRKRAPKARLVLAGASPPKPLLRLAGSRVLVPGRVDDLRPLFEACRVFVAPLRFGAGVKGKIYSAFAHGAPVVTTSIGAEGMALGDGDLALIADDAASLADRILELYSDEALWSRMSAAGLDFIVRNHTLPAGMRAMREALALAADV